MKQYTPHASLIRQDASTIPGDYKYQLYAVTRMDNTQYVSDGSAVTTTVNSDGHYLVELKVKKDTNVAVNLDYKRPVVHLVDLEEITLDSTNPTVLVEVVENLAPTGTSSKGNKVVHVATAEDDGQPL